MLTAVSLLYSCCILATLLAKCTGSLLCNAITTTQNASVEKRERKQIYKNPNLQNRYVKGELVALQKDSLQKNSPRCSLTWPASQIQSEYELLHKCPCTTGAWLSCELRYTEHQPCRLSKYQGCSEQWPQGINRWEWLRDGTCQTAEACWGESTGGNEGIVKHVVLFCFRAYFSLTWNVSSSRLPSVFTAPCLLNIWASLHSSVYLAIELIAQVFCLQLRALSSSRDLCSSWWSTDIVSRSGRSFMMEAPFNDLNFLAQYCAFIVDFNWASKSRDDEAALTNRKVYF